VEPVAAVRGSDEGRLERLFELTSVVPLAGFGFLHLFTYGRVLFGVVEVGSRQAPSALAIVGEALGVWLPLAFHAVYGFAIWARRASTPARAPSERAWLFLHRGTGVVLGVFLVDHCLRFRLPILQGDRYPAESLHAVARELSTTVGGFPVLAGAHELGTLALAFHLAFGLWRVVERRTAGAVAQRWRMVCVGIGLLFALVGTLTVVRLAAG
jgi:succinate dehydrogenase / fumarate reductase cytochrome b subunit